MKILNNKNIVIVGPTSSGKTGLAVKLARHFGGEVISADSRQVYRGMDIGTGKDLEEYSYKIKDNELKTKNQKLKSKDLKPKTKDQGPKKQESKKTRKLSELERTEDDEQGIGGDIIRIPYHLIDVVGPNTVFDLAKFVRQARVAMADIHTREKLPIIAGGTGLYTQALVDGYQLTKTKPDKELREELENLNLEAIIGRLQALNPEFADSLNESELLNKRRLIRYVEIEQNRVNNETGAENDLSQRANYLLIGVACPRDVLYKRIHTRLIFRLEKQAMVEEVRRLHVEYKVSWRRLAALGLEYKYISEYLRGQLTYEQMVIDLDQAIRHFAKRQLSWYRRWERAGAQIHWLDSYASARQLVKNYLNT